MDHILCFLIYVIAAASRLMKPVSRLAWLLSRAGKGGPTMLEALEGSYDEWTPGKPRKILLAGYNGARNTGSDVRTAAIAR